MSKQNVPGHAIQFLAPTEECFISAISGTRSQYLDAYSKGDKNLSTFSCPTVFQGDGLMLAPECYDESHTRKSLDEYTNLPHWNNKHIFKKLIGKMRRSFNVDGTSVSIITQSKTLIKVETLIGISEIPRSISLDGHAILSKDYLLVLDTTKDWRFKKNPFVTGIPFIKFYCGVPIVTSNNKIIGVLAIFDAFAKSEFSISNCNLLKEFSKQIVDILESPIDKFNTQNSTKNENSMNSDLNDLSWKLGRATSTKSMLMTVFEKDGSGGRYTQNHNFRFSKELETNSSNESRNKRLWQKLAQIKSIKNAAMIFTRAISKYYHFDFAYILEIRISENYQLPINLYPKNTSKISCTEFEHHDKLLKTNSQNYDCLTRIVGISGNKFSSLYFDNSIHYQAFTSDYGICYKSDKKSAHYNCGIIMPFHKGDSKLIRTTKEHKSVIDVVLRSGGYLIALFNEKHNNFSISTIEKAHKDAVDFRKLYIT